MFLFQKLNYSYSESSKEMLELFRKEEPNYVVYDTETTGLEVTVDKPFLISVGFDKHVFVFEVNQDSLNHFSAMAKETKMLIAHNAKYDYHMMRNAGLLLEDCNLGDSMTIARLTDYVDTDSELNLKALGMKYVDADSKFAGDVIKKQLDSINAGRRKTLREHIKRTQGKRYKEILTSYDNRVNHLPTELDSILSELDTIYKKPTYYDVYLEKPMLMKHYAADDVVILLEYLKKSLPVLSQVDIDLKTFKRECKLIPVIADLEATGMKADIQYLLDAREAVLRYRELKYAELHKLVGREVASGQHKLIKTILKEKYGLELESTSVESLERVVKQTTGPVVDFATLILELRTIDKWLKTYIEGMLDRIVDGRIHPSINNAGTVSGRVSSNMQQQPKDGLYSTIEVDEEGKPLLLFHPRRVFINDDDFRTFYFDYSQMEMRMQAQYTIWVSGGDVNLCRAFIPFQCTSAFTGEIFDHNDRACVARWNSGEWVNEDFEIWKPTDLHTATTLATFPDLEVGTEEFAKARYLGKRVNFAKNYGAGAAKIQESLDISQELAEKLSNAYYEAFPKIRDYQRWVQNTVTKYGYAENVLGRRYYIQDPRWSYKVGNYLIQGGCADFVKDKEIKIYDLLKGKQSKMILPVHDEVQVMIHKDEEYLVPLIHEILEDAPMMDNIPMTCDIEVTDYSWAEKRDYEKGRN